MLINKRMDSQIMVYSYNRGQISNEEENYWEKPDTKEYILHDSREQ